MATRAEFLVMQKDGSVLQSALVYDGQPSYVVPHLLSKFRTVAGAQIVATAGDFQDISDPVGSKVADTESIRLAKMPKAPAVFAEHCYVFVNRKWHIMLPYQCLLPLTNLVKL